MEGNIYRRKSDVGTCISDGNLEEAPAGSSGTAVTIGNQVDVSTIFSRNTSQQGGPRASLLLLVTSLLEPH